MDWKKNLYSKYILYTNLIFTLNQPFLKGVFTKNDIELNLMLIATNYFYLLVYLLKAISYLLVVRSEWLIVNLIELVTIGSWLLKGVFGKNERGYRPSAIKQRFWSLLILLLSVASIRRKLLKTSHTE